MPGTENRSAADRLIGAVLGGGVAGALWPALFSWWSRSPALWIFEQLERRFGLASAAEVMATDLLFALLGGLLAAELFIRLLRPQRYLPEAIAVAAFLGVLLAKAGFTGDSLVFLLRLPPLWLFLMVYAIRVGYGIKARRQQLAATA